MKNLSITLGIWIAVLCLNVNFFGQNRPVRKTTAPAAKTAAAPASKPVAAPTPKPVVKEVSPAEAFFNEGVKCDAKDYDCQISNYTKAINLNLNTREVFKNRADAYLAKDDPAKAIADFTRIIELNKNEVSGYKIRGKAYLETAKSAQDYDYAIQDFSSAIELEPKDVEAYNFRGSAYLKKKDYDKAAADLNKVSELSPNNPDAYNGLGAIYLNHRNFDKAVEFFNKAAAVKPSYEVYLNRGTAYAAQRKFDSAISDFGKAAEISPQKAEPYAKRAELFLKTRKYDEAIKDWTKAIESDPKSDDYFLQRATAYGLIKKYDESIADSSQAITLNSNNVAAYEWRAAIYFTLKNYDKSLEDASKAITLDPNTAQAYIYRGLSNYYKSGNADAMTADTKIASTNTVTKSTQIIETDPDNFDAYLKRGGGYVSLQLYDKALLDFNKALEIDLKSTEAYQARGNIYNYSKNYEKAIADFDKVTELDPANSLAYFSRASIYKYYLKDDQKVIENTNKIIEINDPNFQPLMPVIYGMLTEAYHNTKNDEQALSMYAKLIAQNPASGEAYESRGNFYAQTLKTPEKAIADYQKAIELAPTKISAYKSLADIYSADKNVDQALQMLNLAVQNNPNSAEAYYNRAFFYRFTTKKYDLAISDYTNASNFSDNGAMKKLYSDSIDDLRGEQQAARERKAEKRKAWGNAILAGLGAANQVVAASQGKTAPPVYVPPTQPTTTTKTENPGRQTSSTDGGQTNGSSNPANGSTGSCGGNTVKQPGSSPNDCHNWLAGAVTTEDKYSWDDCSTDGMQLKHCWGPWQQILPQVQARVVGPYFDRARNSNGKPPYHWTVGYRNNSNTIIRFIRQIVYGDGSTQDIGDMLVLGPGQEFIDQNPFLHTSSNSGTVTLRFTQHEICTDISRTTVNGKQGWKCNLK